MGMEDGCVYVFGPRHLLGKRLRISCRMIDAILEPSPRNFFLWYKAPDHHGYPSSHCGVKDDPELPLVLSVARLAGL